MSSYQAIAGVTATLRALLEDRMDLTSADQITSRRVTITTSHPDVKPQTTASGPRLNLFLYTINHSPHLRNQPINPGRPGLPPLALELQFLATCFPLIEEDDETMHAVLADAMQVLHSTPILTETLLRTRGLGAGEPLLHDSLLESQERIKITFEPQPFANAHQIWSAVQKPYRLSFTFAVSIVQIESLLTPTEAPPVRERQILLEPERRALE